MTEIELKAHVHDRKALAASLNAFAVFAGHVVRDDVYYGLCKEDRRKIRIRKETCSPGSAEEQVSYLVTYKRKELRTDGSGTAVEVNDEKECTVSSPEALYSYLEDTGHTVTLRKHKDVMDWTLALPAGSVLSVPLTATFELCAVPPLGDFLEIEILSPVNDALSVEKIHAELERLLERAGIPRDCIERRYYSELLAQQCANQ